MAGRSLLAAWAAAGVAVSIVAPDALVHAGQLGQGQTPSPLPLSQAIRERGSSVTGAYEGWYDSKDGGRRMLVGYFNRNTKQELDIPIGPNNRIEPGGPDQGQPTHFLAGRQWGVFTLPVPKDLGAKKLTWTLVANGQTNTITLHTQREWVIEPFEDVASQNTPPFVRIQPTGPGASGPPNGFAATLATTLPNPLALTAWVTDTPAKLNVANAQLVLAAPASGAGPPRVPPVFVSWSLFRGPGGVTFDSTRPPVKADEGGRTSVTATFSAPGDYVLRLQANDSSGDGGGGFQCCWTNVLVKVSVNAAPDAK